MTNFFALSSLRSALALSVGMMTCLILLINVSFKIIASHGLVFSASSLLCPLIAFIYFIILHNCNVNQQRHILNQSLLALYLFSVGIYLLVNLPAAENMHDPAYQIVFENIPKKFFASTLAFGLSFYLPHFLFYSRQRESLSPSKKILLALVGGFSFFNIDFFLLFSDPAVPSFRKIYIDSLIINSCILGLIALFHLIFLIKKNIPAKIHSKRTASPSSSYLYHYLVCFSVIIVLICIACEYHLVSFSASWTLTASGLLFPFAMVASNLIGELFGYRANLYLAVALILAELFFDFLLMGTVALPAPDFFNLNPFYSIILPRRIPAGSLALFVTFTTNAILLENLKYTGLHMNQYTRILVANICSVSLLCLVNYSLLYGGIYPYDQIFNLALSSWTYKLGATFITLPLLIWLYKRCENRILLAKQ